MTHPLTPREKVVLKPCPMCGMTDSAENATQESGLHIQSFRSPAGGDACRVQCACGVSGPSSREDWQAAEKWNRRTALASGSGDHAELEGAAKRLADIELSDGGCGYCDAVMDVYGHQPSRQFYRDLKALLAENAALRADVDRLKLAICGGEDAPGAIAAVTVEDCERFCRENHASRGDFIDRATEAERKLAEADKLNDRAADLMRQCTDPERFEGASTLNVYANMRAWLSDLPPAPGAEDE